MSAFTPLASTIGGFMLSLSTSSMMISYGRILGVSGLAHAATSDPLAAKLTPKKKVNGVNDSNAWKFSTLGGILFGGFLLNKFSGAISPSVGSEIFEKSSIGLYRAIIAGLAVGFGTKLGSGCTSGHMLCGLSRFSYRSFVAVLSFFSTAIITAQLFPTTLPPASIPLTATSVNSILTFLLLQLPFLIYTTIPLILSGEYASLLSSFATGIHFSFGLALAGMIKPSKVLSFFYFPFDFMPVQAPWDASLMLVAVGGLLPNILLYQSIQGWSKPLYTDKFSLPTKQDIDFNLCFGSACFGIGWGLSGLCPGPALTVLGSSIGGELGLLPFFASFVVGGALAQL